MNAIEKKLIEYMDQNFGVEIDEHTALFSSSLLHSLNVLQIINFLEKNFPIKIPVMEVSLESFDTVEKIKDLIVKLEKQGHG